MFNAVHELDDVYHDISDVLKSPIDNHDDVSGVLKSLHNWQSWWSIRHALTWCHVCSGAWWCLPWRIRRRFGQPDRRSQHYRAEGRSKSLNRYILGVFKRACTIRLTRNLLRDDLSCNLELWLCLLLCNLCKGEKWEKLEASIPFTPLFFPLCGGTSLAATGLRRTTKLNAEEWIFPQSFHLY